ALHNWELSINVRLPLKMESREKYSKDTYYVLGQTISHEEDLLHEFKGHRNISIHDIPSHALASAGAKERTRNAVSVSIGGMLNSGHGGTIYLGVADNGQVKGMTLTRYQKDHIEVSLSWTLGRYTPPVPESRYSVIFVPVISNKNQTLPQKIDEFVDPKRRSQLHHVAQSNYCWCDTDAKARKDIGKLPMAYVVEIHVHPWEPHRFKVSTDPLDTLSSFLPPLHLTEASACFFRQSCRQLRLCLEDVRRLLVHRVQEHYTLKVEALQNEYKALQCLAQKHSIKILPPVHHNTDDRGTKRCVESPVFTR
ncbi:hypothetical protein OTU49_009924, partial [Cherax quadricarinatus]